MLLMTCAPFCQAEIRYTVTFIPSIPGYGYSEGVAINEQGVVAGFSRELQSPYNPRVFLFANGVTNGFLDGFPGDINASGDVVSYGVPFGSSYRGFVNGQAINPFGGDFSNVRGINDRGDFVGSGSKGAVINAFLKPSSGSIIDLGSNLSAYGSSANAINNSGQITGQFVTASGVEHAFLYSNGSVIDLTPNTYTDCEGTAINGKGQVIIYANGASELYSAGALTGLPLIANGINDLGQIVGSKRIGSIDGVKHAFIYQGGVAEDLNDLIPQKPKWILSVADAINEAGQITGGGNSVELGPGTFLLTPIASAATFGVKFTRAPLITVHKRVLVKGQAAGLVSKVLYRVGEKGPYHVAKGTNSWQFFAKLAIGRNRVSVIVKRPSGKSKPKFIYILRGPNPLRVTSGHA
jgi:probable HAF family extracellular repeat protein